MKNFFRPLAPRRAAPDAPPEGASEGAPEAPGRAARPTAERSAFGADLTVQVHTRTDPGCERTLNEDSVRHAEPPAGAETLGTLVVLADGMGGHAAGEVASRLAVETIEADYYTGGDGRGEPATRLVEAFHAANRAIHRLSLAEARHRGMGTTATALAVLPGGRAVHAQVGDSHLYLLRGGAFYLLSEDHSLVMEMVRNGSLTRAEAAVAEDRNVILRALGTRPRVEISAWPRPLALEPGDRLLLCSDGLHEVVDEPTIQATLAATVADPGAAVDAADRLIDLARAAGGPDNISVALLLVDAPGRPAPAPSADAAPRPTREAPAPAGLSAPPAPTPTDPAP